MNKVDDLQQYLADIKHIFQSWALVKNGSTTTLSKLLIYQY